MFIKPKPRNYSIYLCKYGPKTASARDLGRSIGMSQSFVHIARFTCNNKQFVQLQQGNKRFYKCVREHSVSIQLSDCPKLLALKKTVNGLNSQHKL